MMFPADSRRSGTRSLHHESYCGERLAITGGVLAQGPPGRGGGLGEDLTRIVGAGAGVETPARRGVRDGVGVAAEPRRGVIPRGDHGEGHAGTIRLYFIFSNSPNTVGI